MLGLKICKIIIYNFSLLVVQQMGMMQDLNDDYDAGKQV